MDYPCRECANCEYIEGQEKAKDENGTVYHFHELSRFCTKGHMKRRKTNQHVVVIEKWELDYEECDRDDFQAI